MSEGKRKGSVSSPGGAARSPAAEPCSPRAASWSRALTVLLPRRAAPARRAAMAASLLVLSMMIGRVGRFVAGWLTRSLHLLSFSFFFKRNKHPTGSQHARVRACSLLPEAQPTPGGNAKNIRAPDLYGENDLSGSARTHSAASAAGKMDPHSKLRRGMDLYRVFSRKSTNMPYVCLRYVRVGERHRHRPAIFLARKPRRSFQAP